MQKADRFIATGEKYTNTANYIIFRNIDLGGSARPWTPLMFSGSMYGIKSVNGESLWNNDSTALNARIAANRPVISNVYVNQNVPIKADDYIGVGFFATVTNEVNVADIGVSTGTVKVHNIELNQVEVHNTATTAKEADSLVSTITSSLGWLVGVLVDALTTLLSFGSVNLKLKDTLSAVLNARAKDSTIYSTGAFAGRIVGDVEIKDCAVTGNVRVENLKDNTGGFVGYTDGVTQYSGLSQALSGITDFLSSLLNVIPGLGLGDLITILLDNALPLGNLIPTGYLEPHIINCMVDGLDGDIGQNDTNNNGGFVGLQTGTQIENCTIQNSTYTVKAASLGGGFSGVARDTEIKGTLNDLGAVVEESGVYTYYTYSVEEAPVIGYNSVVTHQEKESTAIAKIVNTPVPFVIEFKYYDRYHDNNTFAGIQDTPTTYSMTLDGIPDEFIVRDASGNAQSVNYAGLIGEKAVEFSNNALR